MRKNVGRADAYMRITCGLVVLTCGGVRLARKHDPLAHMMVFAGAMKVAEGVTGFCPMLTAMHKSTLPHCEHAQAISTDEPCV
jgi:hypothetical protein